MDKQWPHFKYIVHMMRIKLYVSENQTYHILSNCEKQKLHNVYEKASVMLGNRTLWPWKSKNTWQLSVRPQINCHKLDLRSSLSRQRSDVFWFLPLHLVQHLIRDRLSHCSHLLSRPHWKAFYTVSPFLLFLSYVLTLLMLLSIPNHGSTVCWPKWDLLTSAHHVTLWGQSGLI